MTGRPRMTAVTPGDEIARAQLAVLDEILDVVAGVRDMLRTSAPAGDEPATMPDDGPIEVTEPAPVVKPAKKSTTKPSKES